MEYLGRRALATRIGKKGVVDSYEGNLRRDSKGFYLACERRRYYLTSGDELTIPDPTDEAEVTRTFILRLNKDITSLTGK